MRKSHCRISIPLLLIATLHFIVYFSAVTQTNAHTFLVRESANTKQLSYSSLHPYAQFGHARYHLPFFFALHSLQARGLSPVARGLAPDPQLSASALRRALARSRQSQAHQRHNPGLASDCNAGSSDADAPAPAPAAAPASAPAHALNTNTNTNAFASARAFASAPAPALAA